MDWTTIAPGIHCIHARGPTRFQPGINVHVLSGKDGIIIYDPGYAFAGSFRKVLGSLTRLLVFLKRSGTLNREVPLRDAVTMVIASHEHHDHASAASRFKHHFPACRVAASRPVAMMLDPRRRRRKTPSSMSIMSKVLVTIAHAGDRGHGCHVDTILADGDVITAGEHQYTVLVTPGHVPGQLLLHDTSRGLLLSSDLVLGNVATWLGPPRSDYTAYKASMARLASLGARLIAPAHGQVITEPAGRLAELARFRTLRERQIIEACQRPRTARAITWIMYKDRGPVTVLVATGMVRLVSDWLVQKGELAVVTRRDGREAYVAINFPPARGPCDP